MRSRYFSDSILTQTDAVNLFKSARGIDQAVTSFYASPAGTYNARATLADPIDFQAGLANGLLQPGTTLWLRGGIYSGSFSFSGTGTPTAPIVIRNYNGERAHLDLGGVSTVASTINLETASQYVWLWGLEASFSGGMRVSAQSGSYPTDLGRSTGGAFSNQGSYNKIINCIAHDGGNGIQDQSGAVGTELYGNIVSNNGWDGTDRGHGHGIYYQNPQTVLKNLKDNIVFNNFGYNFHAYGTSTRVDYLAHQGNVAMNGGYADTFTPGGSRSPNFYISSPYPTISLSYDSDIDFITSGELTTQGIYLGGGGVGSTLTLTNVRHYGGGRALYLSQFDVVNASGLVISSNGAGDYGMVGVLGSSGGVPAGWSWNNNTYYNLTTTSLGVRNGYRYGPNSIRPFAEFKAGTGLDNNSTQTIAVAPNYVQVRSNVYETGRGNVVVYNSSGATNVAVNLSSLGLIPGQAFTIQNAQNYFGPAVYSGIYNSASPSITLPLTDTSLQVPNNFTPYSNSMVSTMPVFGVFIVIPGR